jgi:DNA polymerase-3 subunit gamma/tau
MSWDAVLGQDGIAETLRNAVATGEISSTYLFHGPRGTGKTTCARIFAKALNCENPIAPGVPCTKCDTCIDIAEDSSPNVTEMDAATNTGVDNMRDLKMSANMVSTGKGWKVYIIDECHMLSKSAQNSGLKLFEESPEKTIFILATTELYKMEGTIVSRSLRFDFRPVGINDIISRLKFVADSEKMETDESALKEIAKAARGSMRDSISILERVSLENAKKISMNSVVRSLGITPVEIMLKLGDVIKGDFKKGFEIAGNIIGDGYDIHMFLQGAVDYFRDLMMVRVGIADGLMIEPELMANFEEVSGSISMDAISNAMEVLDESITRYRYNDNKQILLEMSLYKIAKGVEKKVSVVVSQPVQQPVQQPEQNTVQYPVQQPAPPVQVQSAPAPQPVQQQPVSSPDTILNVPMGAPIENQMPAPVQQPQNQMPLTDYQKVCNGWTVYIEELGKVSKDAFLWVKTAMPKSFDNDELLIEFSGDDTLNVKVFNERLAHLSGKVLSGLMQKLVVVRAVVEEMCSEPVGGDTIGSVTYMQPMEPDGSSGFVPQEPQPEDSLQIGNDVGDQGNITVQNSPFESGGQTGAPINTEPANSPYVQETQSVSHGVQPVPADAPVTPDFLKATFGSSGDR